MNKKQTYEEDRECKKKVEMGEKKGKRKKFRQTSSTFYVNQVKSML